MFLAVMIMGLLLSFGAPIAQAGGGGYDEFGYNYKANNFVGPADGVDRTLDGTVWGDPLYGNDHLKMKWSQAWDDSVFGPDGVRYNGDELPWTRKAWEDNQWNGRVPGGSGEVWHYKIVWVGDCGPDGAELPDGGYCIWGQFEVIMSHGTVDSVHEWETLAKPAGYGVPH